MTGSVPPRLHAAIAADLAPVRLLPAPLVRALWVTPFAVILLVAAPLAFAPRDLEPLGWVWSWGASSLQLVAGLALTVAALREAVPGRSWSTWMLLTLIAAPVALVAVVTIGSWHASPVVLQSSLLQIGLICLVSSSTSALPVAALIAVLAVRAFPTRAGITGFLAGLAGGLMADAGWRLFCEYSEPAHVLAAHLGGVMFAGVLGAWLTRWLVKIGSSAHSEARVAARSQ
jgi:hypothetical protein